MKCVAAIPLEGMPVEVVNDRLPLPLLEPMIPRHQHVVLVRALPYRCRQSKNLPRAIPSQRTTRVTGSSVGALNSRTKSQLGLQRRDLGLQLLLPARPPMTGEHRGRSLEQIALRLVEHAGSPLRRAADLRHRLLVHHVLPDRDRLLLRRVPPACPLAHDSAPFRLCLITGPGLSSSG